MQNESHQPHAHTPVSEDTSLPPSSPSIHPFQYHHQPTPTVETGDPTPTIRRRHTAQPNSGEDDDDDKIRIDIRTATDESGRRKEGVLISRGKIISGVKDEIASGELLGDGQQWVREGMRLVWQGRIIRDEEVIGDVVQSKDVNVVHAIHLVARKRGAVARPRLEATRNPTTTTPAVSAAVPGPSIQTPTAEPSYMAIALSDAPHYLFFTARHHLFNLLSLPVLSWGDCVPKPTVPQEIARAAVIGILRIFANERSHLEGGWENWEKAFEGDSRESLEQVWREAGRERLESEIKALWSSRVGRVWAEEGEVVSVEVDEITHSLHIPPLHLLSPKQLLHLTMYLRITTLLPVVCNLRAIYDTPAQVLAPTPTPTLPVFQHPSLLQRILSIRIPFAVLNHAFWSAIRIIAVLWMLSRDMRWDDHRFISMGVAAAGWWLGDAYHRYIQERPRRQATPAAAAGAAAVPGAPGNAVPAGTTARPRRRIRNPWTILPLLHLDIDSPQLHLPVYSTHSPFDPAAAQLVATEPERAAAIRQRAGPQPSKIQTMILLPICLWFITLIPEWESMRSRAIRKRERAMRVLVGELTSAVNPEGVSLVEGEGQGEVERVLPVGLGEAAGKYYERVLQRGEGIDWEEEREAQRALGVGEEEDQNAGFGFRL